jgi:hypothetical protein
MLSAKRYMTVVSVASAPKCGDARPAAAKVSPDAGSYPAGLNQNHLFPSRQRMAIPTRWYREGRANRFSGSWGA